MNRLHLSHCATLLPISLAFAATLHPQSSNAARTPSALGLLHLKSEAKPNEAARLAGGKFTSSDMSPTKAVSAGAACAKKNTVDYLAVDAGRLWSSTLRSNPREPTYTAFMVHGSQNSIIEVGGARLGVTAGPIPDSLQLMFDDASSSAGTIQWKSLNAHVATGTCGGKAITALPAFAVALEPFAGYATPATAL